MAEYRSGQRVKVVQRGTLRVGPLTLKDNVFEGVVIVGRNPDGTYLVKGIVQTPDSDVVSIPEDWIQPL